MHMMAVGDDADEGLGEIERGADHARLAPGRRAHRIEQMGERARAGLDGGARLRVARLRMAERDEHAAPREFGDALRRDAIGRERQHDRAAIGARDRLDVVGRRGRGCI